MPHKLSFYLITIILLLSSLTGANLIQKKLRDLRNDYQLIDQDEAKNAPPLVTFTTISLGGFRGLVADYLWVRSHLLQEQGDYYETYQLAQWITMLQPRVSAAITNLAWNMAYNISVTYSSYEDRWRWVQKGIELLRDEALEKTKNDPDIYHYLGWIYQHKIGQEADEANRYYKWRLASEMDRVLGDNPNWELLKTTALPKDLIINEKPFIDFLKELNLSTKQLTSNLLSDNKLPESISQKFTPEEQVLITNSLRHDCLLKTYKLDPVLMDEINQQYAPKNETKYYGLDWRLPESHAIYWAYCGTKKAKKEIDLQCDRMIIQCLAIALRSGRISGITSYKDQFGATIPALIMEPNLNTIAPLDRLMTRQHTTYGENVVGSAMEGFYSEAITTLYLYGYQTLSQNYLKKLSNFYQERNRAFPSNMTVDQYVLERITQTMGGSRGSREVLQTISGYLNISFRSLLINEDERAAAMERIAFLMHQKYRSSLGETRLSRINIANFNELYAQDLLSFYKNLPTKEWQDLLIIKRPQLTHLLEQEKEQQEKKK